ncbi:MAG: dockerin type I repeat-containing protein, partial [Prevotella sp.]|nr:dockerin type I repeat-containing protein [Prevotella sp.]
VIKLEEGQELLVRVYPWYNGAATGKTICLSDLRIHGMATDATNTPEGLLGDVNGDELVNISDVVLLVEYILNVDNPSFIKDNADINRDNTINISDVTQLVNIILESD